MPAPGGAVGGGDGEAGRAQRSSPKPPKRRIPAGGQGAARHRRDGPPAPVCRAWRERRESPERQLPPQSLGPRLPPRHEGPGPRSSPVFAALSGCDHPTPPRRTKSGWAGGAATLPSVRSHVGGHRSPGGWPQSDPVVPPVPRSGVLLGPIGPEARDAPTSGPFWGRERAARARGPGQEALCLPVSLGSGSPRASGCPQPLGLAPCGQGHGPESSPGPLAAALPPPAPRGCQPRTVRSPRERPSSGGSDSLPPAVYLATRPLPALGPGVPICKLQGFG